MKTMLFPLYFTSDVKKMILSYSTTLFRCCPDRAVELNDYISIGICICDKVLTENKNIDNGLLYHHLKFRLFDFHRQHIEDKKRHKLKQIPILNSEDYANTKNCSFFEDPASKIDLDIIEKITLDLFGYNLIKDLREGLIKKEIAINLGYSYFWLLGKYNLLKKYLNREPKLNR